MLETNHNPLKILHFSFAYSLFMEDMGRKQQPSDILLNKSLECQDMREEVYTELDRSTFLYTKSVNALGKKKSTYNYDLTFYRTEAERM